MKSFNKFQFFSDFFYFATSNVVENHIKMHYDSKGVDKLLSPLLKNVPYRFLSPWVKYTTD